MPASHLDPWNSPQRDDLQLLSIFHWVLAGLAAIFSLLPLIYVVMGGLIVAGSFDGRHDPGAVTRVPDVGADGMTAPRTDQQRSPPR